MLHVRSLPVLLCFREALQLSGSGAQTVALLSQTALPGEWLLDRILDQDLDQDGPDRSRPGQDGLVCPGLVCPGLSTVQDGLVWTDGLVQNLSD